MNVVWAVMRGKAPDAPVVDPGLLGIPVPFQVMEWADGYGWGRDPGIWVAVAPSSVARRTVDAAVAWCEGYLPEEQVKILTEIVRLKQELAACRALAADATEYRVLLPELGGTELLIKRQSLAHGNGWAASTMARGGGRAWTTEGWQDSISALSVDRLFCWPDPATAIAEIRGALASPVS